TGPLHLAQLPARWYWGAARDVDAVARCHDPKVGGVLHEHEALRHWVIAAAGTTARWGRSRRIARDGVGPGWNAANIVGVLQHPDVVVVHGTGIRVSAKKHQKVHVCVIAKRAGFVGTLCWRTLGQLLPRGSADDTVGAIKDPHVAERRATPAIDGHDAARGVTPGVIGGHRAASGRRRGAGRRYLTPVWLAVQAIGMLQDPNVVWHIHNPVIAATENRHCVGVRIVYRRMFRATRGKRSGRAQLGPGRNPDKRRKRAGRAR